MWFMHWKLKTLHASEQTECPLLMSNQPGRAQWMRTRPSRRRIDGKMGIYCNKNERRRITWWTSRIQETVGLWMRLLRRWETGWFFRSFSLRSATTRRKRSKKSARCPTRLATNSLTRQPPSWKNESTLQKWTLNCFVFASATDPFLFLMTLL